MKNIAILYGGHSSEYVISVKSAQTVKHNLDIQRYTPWMVHVKDNTWQVVSENETVEINKNDFSCRINNELVHFDHAIIMIHGTPGENGLLQAYFDMLNIPYYTSGVLASALSFNKFYTKQYLRAYNIPFANEILIKNYSNDISNIVDKEIGYPCFIKPNNAGSSFGVSKINNAGALEKAVKHALTEDEEVLVEKFIKGTEITCGIIRTTKKTYLLPATEIVSKTSFFDFEAKYHGKSEEITPARIPDDILKYCQDITLEVFNVLGCKGIARVDFIIENNIPYMLEINTVPGMSAESIIPQQIEAMGMNLSDVLTELIG